MPKKESEFSKNVKKYKEQNAHFITPIPEIEEISYLDRPVFEVVQISSNPDHKEIYLPDTKKTDECRLTAMAKEKLAMAAGVIWNLQETGVTEKSRDYVSYRAVGGIRKPDGQFVYLSSTYDRDIEALKEKLESQYSTADDKYNYWAKAKWNKGKTRSDFVLIMENNFKRDLRQQRTFMSQLAETGAKVRAITKLLNLKSTYTQKELSFPFVAVRIVFNQNNQDPMVKKALLETRLAAEFNLYGPSKPTPQLPAPEIIEDTTVDEADYDETPDIENENDIYKPEDDFLKRETPEQLTILQELSESKNYNLGSYLEQLKNGFVGLSDAKKIGLFNHIKSMEDDDIPF